MIRIKHKVNGAYAQKGTNDKWTDFPYKNSNWKNIAGAKSHVKHTCFNQGISCGISIEHIRKYMETEFEIIDENGSITSEDVMPYILESIMKEFENCDNRYKIKNKKTIEELGILLSEIEENNQANIIKIGETDKIEVKYKE